MVGSLKKTILYKPLVAIKSSLVHIFYPFGYIRNYVLFPIAGFLRINHIPPFYNKYKFIDDIRDKYKGKRCFIIATGPSLRMQDVERLENEITIGMNSFYRIYDKTQFRPTFKDSVLCVAASDFYEVEDYIRDYDEFVKGYV